MPNRILKDSLCRSDSFAKLSWFDQCVFTRLIVLADDYGRYDARPAIIKGVGFPLHDEITADDIDNALSHIAETGMIILYSVDGKRYLQFTAWQKHQKIRNKKSKYPTPDGMLIASDGTCVQLCANDAPIQSESNPNQSESESNQNPNPNQTPIQSKGMRDSEVEEETLKNFKIFWKAYPIHRSRSTALAEFCKVEVPLQTLLNALDAQKKTENWQKDGGRWIPAPDNWLRDERWEDSMPGTGANQYEEGLL